MTLPTVRAHVPAAAIFGLGAALAMFYWRHKNVGGLLVPCCHGRCCIAAVSLDA
jgi:hypothetical protein